VLWALVEELEKAGELDKIQVDLTMGRSLPGSEYLHKYPRDYPQERIGKAEEGTQPG
jgi:hypothetical protein